MHKITRRKALQIVGHGAIAGGAFLVVGCNEGEKPSDTGSRAPAAKKAAPEPAPKADDGCSGTIDATSKQLRETLQYVEKSPKADQDCKSCLQYVQPAEGKTCGGCKLFTGPVTPEGYCLSFAPQAAAPATQ